jgi:hypothetical protein
MHQIYMSYDPADELFAVRLTDDLTGYGAKVWLDVHHARPGRHWSRSISRALGESSMMIVVLSPEAMQSRRVAAEWQSYLEAYRPVLPVLYSPCDLPAPLFTRRPVDFTRDRMYERAFHALMNRLIDYSTRVRQQQRDVPWSSSLWDERSVERAPDSEPYARTPSSHRHNGYSDPDTAHAVRRVIHRLCAVLGR